MDLAPLAQAAVPCDGVFLTQSSPFPANEGAKLRDQSVLRAFSELGANLKLVTLLGNEPRAVACGKRSVIERATARLRPHLLNGYSDLLEEELRRHAAPGRLLWISRLNMAKYLHTGVRMGYRVVLDQHNFESPLAWREAIGLKQWKNWPAALQFAQVERRFCREAHELVATSRLDALDLRRLSGRSQVHVLPNTIDCHQYSPLREQLGHALVFTGNLAYRPNIEGLLWFARRVLPRLRERMGSRLPPIWVAGARPTPGLVAALERQGIQVIANPPTILPILAQARACFVPLWAGRGTRLKILEALAAGRPVISTPKGCEGLDLAWGRDLRVADSAESFARGVSEVLNDPHQALELARAGARTVERKYDWRVLMPGLRALIQGERRP